MNFFVKLQNLDRRILYMFLIVGVTIGFYVKATIPTNTDPSSNSFYEFIMTTDPEKPVLVQSDWTNNTRGESMGHCMNLLRILMGRNIKFVIYSAADPIAPEVYRTTIRLVNEERIARGLDPYVSGVDYIDLGYFANAEATNMSMSTNIRGAFDRSVRVPGQGTMSIWKTDMLKDIQNVSEFGGMVVITASASIDIALQRLASDIGIGALVTGVTAPTVLPYYQSGQCKGVGAGLKGVYDVEYLMEHGLNGKYKFKEAVNDPEAITFARGASYYLSLHIALTILILAVILGNVAMLISKRKSGGVAK